MSIAIADGRLVLPPSPLHDSVPLARLAGVKRVLVKDERARPFGNFKILGGLVAGLRTIARHRGVPVETIDHGSGAGLTLLCASDGNHGLAVAAGAQAAGAAATIYLHRGVRQERSRRIEALSATIVWIDGTYDDAVDAAASAAAGGEGLLIPDTSADPGDRVVADVMDGYGTLTDELAGQFDALGCRPSHAFVQAGVGGLAAAVAQGLRELESGFAHMIVVEPASAACVAYALDQGRIGRVEGDLRTSADMLSCGMASAAALEALLKCNAKAIAVDEAALGNAVALASRIGLATTASGAAGIAGLLMAVRDSDWRDRLDLVSDSVVLLLVTEAAAPPARG